eukprot:SAG25_NODE_3388_length_1100_cov_12.266733_2_plen_193_part_00
MPALLPAAACWLLLLPAAARPAPCCCDMRCTYRRTVRTIMHVARGGAAAQRIERPGSCVHRAACTWPPLCTAVHGWPTVDAHPPTVDAQRTLFGSHWFGSRWFGTCQQLCRQQSVHGRHWHGCHFLLACGTPLLSRFIILRVEESTRGATLLVGARYACSPTIRRVSRHTWPIYHGSGCAPTWSPTARRAPS